MERTAEMRLFARRCHAEWIARDAVDKMGNEWFPGTALIGHQIKENQVVEKPSEELENERNRLLRLADLAEEKKFQAMKGAVFLE